MPWLIAYSYNTHHIQQGYLHSQTLRTSAHPQQSAVTAGTVSLKFDVTKSNKKGDVPLRYDLSQHVHFYDFGFVHYTVKPARFEWTALPKSSWQQLLLLVILPSSSGNETVVENCVNTNNPSKNLTISNSNNNNSKKNDGSVIRSPSIRHCMMGMIPSGIFLRYSGQRHFSAHCCCQEEEEGHK
jgi:hypothetical protein